MNPEIILTPKAKDTLLSIVLFIGVKWETNQRKNLLKKLIGF
jgi:plasmid stabilization system protein ParE